MSLYVDKFQKYMNENYDFYCLDGIIKSYKISSLSYMYTKNLDFGYRFEGERMLFTANPDTFSYISKYFKFDSSKVLKLINDYFLLMETASLLEKQNNLESNLCDENIKINFSSANLDESSKKFGLLCKEFSIDFSSNTLDLRFYLPISFKTYISLIVRHNLNGCSFKITKPIKSLSFRRNRKSYINIQYDEIMIFINKHIINRMRDLLKNNKQVKKNLISKDFNELINEMIILDMNKY